MDLNSALMAKSAKDAKNGGCSLRFEAVESETFPAVLDGIAWPERIDHFPGTDPRGVGKLLHNCPISDLVQGMDEQHHLMDLPPGRPRNRYAQHKE
jgi:hypothetical protein